jgi:opacity protein-like surface antigen
MIKNIAIVAAACAALISGVQAGSEPAMGSAPRSVMSAPSQGGNGGVYLEATGGALWITNEFEVDRSDANLEFDTGWGVNLGLGYEFDFGLRAGLTLGYHEADLQAVFRGDEFDIADVTVVPILLGAEYRGEIMGNIFGYIGGGLGAYYSDIDLGEFGSEDDWDFGLMGRSGIGWSFAEGASLTVGYRYQHIFAELDDLNAHMFEGGLGIVF